MVKEENIKKAWPEGSDSERKKAQYDSLAKNIITSALNMDEFSGCHNVVRPKKCGKSWK